ncbi:MAG TPA: asparaginase [Polyangiaceae bacterium]|nr:asparaginase [Polyangiaceae bacterium]
MSAVVVTRGSGVEAMHEASIAVVGPGAKRTHESGDPGLVTFARSTLKPFQALPLVTTGAVSALGIDAEEIAIACGSHGGTELHVRVVERLLARAGVGPEALGCGAHLPIAYRIAGRAAEHGEDRDPLRNNCSGKHAGFLCLARRLGTPFEAYLDPEAPVQRAVRAALADVSGTDVDSAPRGTDGCSAPNYALPLEALARAMLRLALAERDAGGLDAALATIREAMTAHPLLVASEKRFDYDLMRTFPGNAVSKAGAEAIQLFAFRDPPFAVAVKIHDGSARALAPVCLAVLRRLGIVGEHPPEALVRYDRPRIKNHRGIVTGEIVATVELARVEAPADAGARER